uniref:NYN domain-containing protein n=1 Tax=Noccaea caerulescens TaxID=107243 RepID=A0A1J3ELX7_NOCCA
MAPIEVKVIWDFQNAWVHDESYDSRSKLKQRIQNSLNLINRNYFVHKVIVVGPRNAKSRLLEAFPNDFDFIYLPDDNIRCGRPQPPCGNMVNRSQDNTNNTQLVMRTTDRADLRAVMKMHEFVLSGFTDVLVIQGDVDYLSPIQKVNSFANVMVAKPNTDSCAHMMGARTWIWEDMISPQGSYPID